MILRPVLAATNVWSAPVDPSATFEAGQIAGLIEIAGELFVTVSDGVTIPPIGVIDDNKTRAFTGTVTDEVQLVPASVVQNSNGQLVSTQLVMWSFEETNLIESSFTSNIDLVLNPKKGVFTIPAGTPVNYQDSTGFIGFEVIASYRFKIVDFPGDDSTDGSGQISIHFNRGIFATNIFDTLATYQPGSPLFVNSQGQLTSQETGSPNVAIALQPSTSVSNELLFMWL